MPRRLRSLAPTTGVVSWTIFEADDFNCPRIDITFDAAPTSAGLLTVTKDSALGASYDSVIKSIDPRGLTTISFENLYGFANGDALVIGYANPDGVGVTASATVEIPLPLEDLSVGGLTASAGTVRSSTSEYRRYLPIVLFSADPGASGATWEAANANYLGGQRLNLPTDTLQAELVLYADWDTSQDPSLEARITNMAAGTAPTDIIKFQFTLYYGQQGTLIRGQTFFAERTVGLLPQYTFLRFDVDIDKDAIDNPLLPGDTIFLEINLDAASDIDDVVIHQASFYYPTTHVGTESGDV